MDNEELLIENDGVVEIHRSLTYKLALSAAKDTGGRRSDSSRSDDYGT